MNGMSMEWSDLRVFLAIAREGTLGAAARKLGQSQPTMGRRLIALERAIGQTLFQRTKGGFVLTDEGAAVMPHAESMEDEAFAVQRRLAGRDREMEGQLRLSSSDWFGTHVLAPVLAEFAMLQPRVTIELITSQLHMSLPRRDADLVFRIRPFDEPEVVSRRLLHVAYGVYLQHGLEVPRLGDGTGMTLVTMDTAFADMPDAVWLKKMLPNAHVGARSNNRDVQASLCARGVGIAVLPRLIGDALVGVTRVELGEDPPGRDTWIGYHRDLRRLARLRVLLDLVFARLAN
jgi:DNA-binding transcriptional LysR family regulator